MLGALEDVAHLLAAGADRGRLLERRPGARASMRAIVVLPLPGGP